MTKYIAALFLFLTNFLFSAESKTHIKTQKIVPGCYISKIHHSDRTLELDYTDKILHIFKNDMTLSGFVEVSKYNSEYEEYLRNPRFEKFISNHGYFIRPSIQKNKFCLKILNGRRKKTFFMQTELLVGDLNLDRSKIHNLTEELCQLLFKSKGCSNLKILYSLRKEKAVGETTTPISEIWMADADGQNSVQVTQEESYCVCPQFIPKHRKSSHLFMYISYGPGQSKLFFAPLYQPENKVQYYMPGNQHLPCISLTRDKMAFISDAAGQPDLFIQKINSKGRFIQKPIQLYSYPNATQASPCFHPDGNKIAFVSDKSGTPRIYTLDLMKFQLHKLPELELITSLNRENTAPSWSHDGLKLAYSAKTNGIRQIWMYDFVTKQEIQLTYGPKHKENPNWAPDNLHIIYNTETIDEAELYCFDLHRLKPIKISDGSGRKRFAVFEPK